MSSDISSFQPTDELQSQIDDIQTELDAVDTSNINVPKYAIVTEIGRKYIEVSTYGAGDYPVVVILYGTGLKTDEIDSTDDNVIDEFLYETYRLTSATGIPLLMIPNSATVITQLIPSATPPNEHEHNVTISGLTVSGTSYTLTFDGTMLVVVVEPDKEWEASDTFELNIKDISGEIYYATAVVSTGE